MYTIFAEDAVAEVDFQERTDDSSSSESLLFLLMLFKTDDGAANSSIVERCWGAPVVLMVMGLSIRLLRSLV